MVYAYLLEGVYILNAWWMHAHCMVYTYLPWDFCMLTTYIMVCVSLLHSLCILKHSKFVTKECVSVDTYVNRLVTHGLRTQQNNLWDFYLLMQVLMYGLVMFVVQGGVMATCQCPNIQRSCSFLCAFLWCTSILFYHKLYSKYWKGFLISVYFTIQLFFAWVISYLRYHKFLSSRNFGIGVGMNLQDMIFQQCLS